MFANASLFEVFEENGLYGLRFVDTKYVVLLPKFKGIKLSLGISFIETTDGDRYELLVETYGDEKFCVRNNQNGQRSYLFIDQCGQVIITIDKEWEKTHRCNVMGVINGFVCGVATLELSGSNEYHSFRALINSEGNVISEYCLDLMEEVLNPKDYLNYDGYGMPPSRDPYEDL